MEKQIVITMRCQAAIDMVIKEAYAEYNRGKEIHSDFIAFSRALTGAIRGQLDPLFDGCTIVKKDE